MAAKMCLAVYIASDAELPLVPFVKGSSAIAVHSIVRECLPSWVRRQNVVNVCTFGRCGGGFLADGHLPLVARADRTQQALDGLARYVERVASVADLDVIACWMGDEEEPRSAGGVTPDFFRSGDQPFAAAFDRPIRYAVLRLSGNRPALG